VERLFAVASPGLESVLLDECRTLPATARGAVGGVELEGEEGLHQRANLTLRTASRVLLRLAEFPCKDAQALRAGMAKVPWERWLGKASRVRVSASAPRRFDAIELFEKVTRRQSTGEADENLPGVWIRVDDDRGTLSVDTTGELLHKRGYRQEVSRAPLRETLAAGMLLLAGYSGDEPLWDPMCGSGTLVIEGAGLALKLAPGLNRAFAFQAFPGFDAGEWASTVERLKQAKVPPRFSLRGTDLHAGSLGTARRNARRAGVLEQLQLERQDARTLAAPSGPPGLLITNVPYGIRVGEREALAPLFRDFGANLKARFQGWRFAILAADAGFATASGLPVDRTVPLPNGGIRCQLMMGRLAG